MTSEVGPERSRLDHDHRVWLVAQMRRQLDFGRGFPHPEGGAAWLDSAGRPDLARPVFTWITARMVHVYSLGSLAGVTGCEQLADIALRGLTHPLQDSEHGGWLSSVGPDQAVDGTKSAYATAFVVLAGASATVAQRPGGRDLLDTALDVLDSRFLTSRGLYAERWDRAWSRLDDYRGVNANMHAVEALLAASDATGRQALRDRALAITTTVVDTWARANQWRVPEHFDPDWQPMLDHHRDQPDHPFEPFGATVGHGLEWSRLVLDVRAALGGDAPDWMLPAARSLFDRAVADGWAVDGQDGFVYTTDWDGTPVVRERMHWVLCEAICAAAALHEATGEAAYDERYRTWWGHAVDHWIDPVNGSWQHQLTPGLMPSDSVWSGRPDLYHSMHATLLPRLPLHRGAAAALREGG